MDTRKLNDVSLSGMITNNAVFLSPSIAKSNSSVTVNDESDSRLNFSSFAAKVIWMDF